MIKLEISPIEKRDIIKYLKVANKVLSKKAIKKGEKWDNSNYHKMRIDYLISLLNGQIDNSTLQMINYATRQARAKKNKEKVPVIDLPYFD